LTNTPGDQHTCTSLELCEPKTEPSATLLMHVSYESPAVVLQDLLSSAPAKQWQAYGGYEPNKK
jgi:hypothetical protein